MLADFNGCFANTSCFVDFVNDFDDCFVDSIDFNGCFVDDDTITDAFRFVDVDTIADFDGCFFDIDTIADFDTIADAFLFLPPLDNDMSFPSLSM